MAAQLYWEKHIQAMRAAGFSNGTQLYVACGLLSYGNQLGWEQVAVSIARQGLGGEVRAKEHFLSAQELAGEWAELAWAALAVRLPLKVFSRAGGDAVPIPCAT